MDPKAASPIAIIGMAARFPGANDVEQYWLNLLDGIDSIKRVPPEDNDGVAATERYVPAVGKVDGIEFFDAEYFRIPPAEAVVMDPQHRVLLEVAVAAMEDAGYHGATDVVVGIFAGCGENFYLREFVTPNGHPGSFGVDQKVLSGNAADFLTARIAFKLGLRGPSVTVQTTCATSLTAVSLACAALAAGDCDIALAGGVSLLMPDVHGYTYTDGGIFSSDGHCRTFDERASGTAPSSGAALVVLRRDEDAVASRDRRRAVIRGWAVSNDGGSSAGFTAPSPSGQERVIRRALLRAGLSPDDIGYLEAHGTATPLGDPIELDALRRVFATTDRAPESCILGAVKSNIGHTDAAAGIAGLIKATFAVQQGVVPGTVHFTSPNPALDLASSPFVISAKSLTWAGDPPRIAGVSAFGLGGNDAHVVVEEAANRPNGEVVRPESVVTLSARTEGALLEMRTNLAHWIQAQGSLTRADLADVAFTLAVGRPHFQYRWAASVSDLDTLVARLCESSEPISPTRHWSLSINGLPRDLLVMGRRLFSDEPLYRETMARLSPFRSVDELPEAQAAALAGIAAVVTLGNVGLDVSRVYAPAWAQPVASWWASGADLVGLTAALRECDENVDEAVPRDASRSLLVDGDFALSDALAHVWSRGARIDWHRYYSVEPRGRVSLPTYPFARQRFWLNRPKPQAADEPAPDAGTPAAAKSTDVLARVEAVWKDVLGLDSVDHGAHFLDDLDGDSLYAVEIGARLSESFHVELPLDLPFVAPTIAVSARYIEQVLTEEAS